MGQRTNEPMTGAGALPGDVPMRPAEPAKETAAIASGIDRTRSQMSGTIDQIEERLSPARMKEQLLDQFHDAKERMKSEVRGDLAEMRQSLRREIDGAKESVREATIGRVEHMVHDANETIQETGSTVMSTIRDNPIPALLAGVGLTWLLLNAQSQRAERRYDGRYGFGPRGGGYGGGAFGARESWKDRAGRAFEETASGARQAAGHAVDRVRHAAEGVEAQATGAVQQAKERVGALVEHAEGKGSELVERAEESVGRFVHDAEDRAMVMARDARFEAQRLEARAERMLNENPLGVAAAAFAVGAAVGLSLPHTQREDQLFGPTRDRLLRQAEGTAAGTLDAAREKVERAIQSSPLGSSKPAQPRPPSRA